MCGFFILYSTLFWHSLLKLHSNKSKFVTRGRKVRNRIFRRLWKTIEVPKQEWLNSSVTWSLRNLEDFQSIHIPFPNFPKSKYPQIANVTFNFLSSQNWLEKFYCNYNTFVFIKAQLSTYPSINWWKGKKGQITIFIKKSERMKKHLTPLRYYNESRFLLHAKSVKSPKRI